MKTRILLLLTLLLCLGLGCLKETTVDPNTGETETTWQVDPNKADKGEAIAEVAVGAGGVASLFWPALVPLVSAGAAGLATWRKIRPKLEQATHERDVGFKAGSAMAEAFDFLKEKHPAVWDDVKPIIEKVTKPASEMENTIRGFRGLSPRDA